MAPDPSPRPVPSRRQAIALLAVLALVAATTAVVSYVVRPDRSRSFALVHGSVFLSDAIAPVAVDLASGRPTVRLVQATRQVGARTTAELAVVPLGGGALLLNRRTGQFDMVAPTGFVVRTDGGVALPRRAGSTAATAIADGTRAYVEQTGPSGTSVYLVDQSTVRDVASTSDAVDPRALATMPQPTSTAPGAAVTAHGDLWMLVGSGATRTVRRLHVPANSPLGVRLAASSHGNAPAVSALEASRTGAVAVADRGAIRVLHAASDRMVGFAPVAGADTVLAATQAGDRLSFLIHGTHGWSLVSVADDGSDLRGPTRLAHVPPAADLGAPAESNGSLYTVDRSTGWTYRIDERDGTSAVAAYPLARDRSRVIEPGGYADAYVVARGDRVIVNSPSHLDALVLFTDGSRGPLTIEKSSAVSVSASSGADALTRSRHARSRTHATPRTAAQRRPVTPVDTTVDCSRVRLTPHIPSFAAPVPGSQSVELSWRYPTTSAQDCLPSTYVLSAVPTTPGRPTPAPLTVQGRTSAVLTGLLPLTRYEITVTAYLNGRGTSSAPLTVTTGRAGPPAPTAVRVVTGDTGTWTLTWTSCATRGCLPSAEWRVVPQYCDGVSVTAAPTPLTVTSPTASVGGDTLLGRGLRFVVEGVGADGGVSAPSAATPCTYSWTPPVAADISVQASTPPTGGRTTTATVGFAAGAVHDLGGLGGTLTYRLLDAGGDVVATKGPTVAQRVDLGGMTPGDHYRVQVVATPPRHPEDAVTLPAVAVTPAQQAWPTPDVSATFTTDGPLQGTLAVSFQLPGVADLHGETFDLAEGSALVCGGQQKSLDGDDVHPGAQLTFPVDREQFSGSCHVDVVLEQHPATATDPPQFGAGLSPVGADPVTLDAPSDPASAADFSASWNAGYQPSVQVAYDGDAVLPQVATGFTMSVGDGAGDGCGSASAGPSVPTLAVTPGCVTGGGAFTVHVHYVFAGQDEDFTVPVTGDAPNPASASDVSFAAAWNDDATDPAVVLTESGPTSPSVLSQLTWTATVTSGGATCGTSSDGPHADGTITVAVDYTACPPTDADGQPATYSTEVEFDDPVYGGHGDYTPSVDGTPPS